MAAWPVVARSGPTISNVEPTCRPNVAAVCVLITTWITGSFGADCLSWLAAVPSPDWPAMGLPVLGLTKMGLAPGWVMTGMPVLVLADGAGVATGKRPLTSRTAGQ